MMDVNRYFKMALAAAAAVLLLPGCLIYSDKDEVPADPSLTTFDVVYDRWIFPAFHAAELAYFMEDPGRMNESDLFCGHFVWHNKKSLYVSGWGEIWGPFEDGNYLVDNGMDYFVEPVSPGSYVISCEYASDSGYGTSEQVGLERAYPDVIYYEGVYRYMITCTVCIDDGVSRMTECIVDFTDYSGITIHAVSLSEMRLPLPSSPFPIYPVSGRMHFEVSGPVTDIFLPLFSPEGVQIERLYTD